MKQIIEQILLIKELSKDTKLVAIDGTEKAGKTSFINKLFEEYPNQIVHRKQTGAADPNWTIYLQHVFEDLMTARKENKRFIVWDRSWASEAVYTRLVRRLSNPGSFTLMENVFSNIFDTKLMLLGEGNSTQFSRRDDSDMPVSPPLEFDAFEKYAISHNWWVHKPQRDRITPEDFEMDFDNLLLKFRFFAKKAARYRALGMRSSSAHRGKKQLIITETNSWSENVFNYMNLFPNNAGSVFVFTLDNLFESEDFDKTLDLINEIFDIIPQNKNISYILKKYIRIDYNNILEELAI